MPRRKEIVTHQVKYLTLTHRQKDRGERGLNTGTVAREGGDLLLGSGPVAHISDYTIMAASASAGAGAGGSTGSLAQKTFELENAVEVCVCVCV